MKELPANRKALGTRWQKKNRNYPANYILPYVPTRTTEDLGANEVTPIIQQRQRERSQIEPRDPLSVFGIKAVPLDAMLSEFVTATVQFAFAEAGHRRTPITVRTSAANVLHDRLGR